MVKGTHIVYSESYPTMYADTLLHILQDIYQTSAPPLLSGTNIYNSPYVNFKLRTFEATQIKHIPKFSVIQKQ